MSEHEHEWTREDYNYNEDRIRTLDVCEACGARRFGCYANRLASDGLPAWGWPGHWTYEIEVPT